MILLHVVAALALTTSAPCSMDSPVESGITIRPTSCDVLTRVTFGQEKVVSRSVELRAVLNLPKDGPPALPQGMTIIELRDGEGKNLLEGEPSGREPRPWHNGSFAAMLQTGARRAGPEQAHVHARANKLREPPRSIALVRARAEVLVAGTTRRTPIVLEPMENPVEIGPGVTLLVTKTEARGGCTFLWYEVRIAKPRAGEGIAPVFAGLELTNDEGEEHGFVREGEEFDTRDEKIIAVRGVDIGRVQDGAVKATAVVLADLRMEEIEVEARDLPMIEGGHEPR
jgi:hypothetical protein